MVLGAAMEGSPIRLVELFGSWGAESLEALMTKLRSTEHHYIRCLKPNQTLKAGDWDNDFMFKQLAYSGTLEVTEIRKAGLNVRRPLAHFYRYYKICADDQTMLRAGTVTKRTELLLDQLGIDENKWRVGKTLVFLKDYEIMDQLDKLREEKIVEYVIILQSYFRMLKDYQKFRRRKRAVQRLQADYAWAISLEICVFPSSLQLLSLQLRCWSWWSCGIGRGTRRRRRRTGSTRSRLRAIARLARRTSPDPRGHRKPLRGASQRPAGAAPHLRRRCSGGCVFCSASRCHGSCAMRSIMRSMIDALLAGSD